ncbi:hypothetical protein WR25_16626 [Diploscapter pachys]|uniref:Uroporphyrinogen decarboxylase (URO-D) domain-containing protein n=1 Tax=Diploscapter pachys TaxID=2018661 RepID=A0A2A2KGJ4_9BILA|nr:hypothetical protein WR25_16626 [Diploscapter pachys]
MFANMARFYPQIVENGDMANRIDTIPGVLARQPVGRRTLTDPVNKPLLATLKGAKPAVPPMWLMRQAGRYLPEYRALRAEKGGFLALATDPVAAAEVTLQPIRRFGFDGAILFSDILMVPWALGQELTFGPGEGPRLTPPLVDHALGALERVPQRLEPVYATFPGRSRPIWWRGRGRRIMARHAVSLMPTRLRSARSSMRSSR